LDTYWIHIGYINRLKTAIYIEISSIRRRRAIGTQSAKKLKNLKLRVPLTTSFVGAVSIVFLHNNCQNTKKLYSMLALRTGLS